jgi:hypothetical protein
MTRAAEESSSGCGLRRPVLALLRPYDKSAQVGHSSRPSHSVAAPLRTHPRRLRRRQELALPAPCLCVLPPRQSRRRRPAGSASAPALPGPAPLHVCLLLLRRRSRRRSRAAAPTGESRNSSLDRFGPRQIRSGRGWLPVSIPALGRAARSYCLGVVAVRLVQWLGSAVWWVPVLGAVSQGKLAALARC